MADQAPANRAERRARARPPKGSKTVFLHQAASAGSTAAKRQAASLSSQNEPPSQDIGTSSASGASDVGPDYYATPVTEQEQAVFSGYRGKYGLIKTNIVTSYATVGMFLGGPASADGQLFLGSAEPIADAWIAWGKADPRYMRVVNLLWGGPFMTLMLAHAPLIAGVMANHGVRMPSLLNPLQMPMFKTLPFAGQNANAGGGTGTDTLPTASDAIPPYDPFTANYRPVGANAPTEDPGPPPSPPMDAPLRLYPDEGIPADVESQLRTLAGQVGVPYAQIRDQYLLETAQDRIARNQHITPPAALGMPVTQPGA
jgi:hypothetical protein